MKNLTKSIVLAFLVISSFLSSCSKSARPAPDAIYRAGDQRTGVHNVEPVTQLTGVLWKFQTGGQVWSSPVEAGGLVFAGTSDGRTLFAVRAKTGETVWQFPAKGYVWGSPSLAGEVVYVGSGNKSFYAINALTGQELWHFETGAPVYSTPWISQGVVIFGSNDGAVYALH